MIFISLEAFICHSDCQHKIQQYHPNHECNFMTFYCIEYIEISRRIYDISSEFHITFLNTSWQNGILKGNKKGFLSKMRSF